MKVRKISGYIFLKYHTYISAEAFYNGESLLFCTLPAIGSSHYVFLYNQLLSTFSDIISDDLEEIYIHTKEEDYNVLDAVLLKLKHYLSDFNYVVFESTSCDKLKKFTELYYKNIYNINRLLQLGNEMINKYMQNSNNPIYTKIYSNVFSTLEWREQVLYREDYMAY